MHWQISRRQLQFHHPLVMGILNVTPDSFSDGAQFTSVDGAVRRAGQMIEHGVDIIDIGGESTRPGSKPVSVDEEIARTLPVIEAIAKRFDTPISIDTSKSEVARRAVEGGAEIINDISGLRFDQRIAAVAADSNAGLVLMHSRGTFETLHSQPPVYDILTDVTLNFHRAIALAGSHGVQAEQIVLDIGLGFGKTLEQNLELIAKLDKIATAFNGYPMLVGASRKSFIGKILDRPSHQRLEGSLASAAIAVWNGARIIRAHDVRETVDTLKIVGEINEVR